MESAMPVRASHISYAYLLGFLCTVFMLQWHQRPSYVFAAIVLAICFLILLLLAALLPVERATALRLSAAMLGILTACAAVARTTHVAASYTVDTYARGEDVTVRGTVAAEPDKRPMKTKYTIAVREIVTASGSRTGITGNILATDHRQWPEYQYGDSVEVRGILEKPTAIETFHYDRYLSRYGIYAVMYRASMHPLITTPYSLLPTPNPNPSPNPNPTPYRLLFSVKSRFEAQINRLYAEPHASFMAGLLTGSRRGIPEALMEDFNTTGLTHIIAISGYNITIVITVISGMLFWLPLKWRFVPAVGAIIAFTAFVGASAAVVRAAIMGILGLLALQCGRQYDVRLGILWTACSMLAWNPKQLWYDAGFQLSFLAVLGLTEMAPLLERWFRRIPAMLGVREALQMTCAAQLAAVPLIIQLFGRFSLVAPFANVLVAPVIPLAMLFGFAGTVLSFIAFFPGQMIAYAGWGCLEWIVQIARVLADVPYASVDMPRMHSAVTGTYYVGLAYLMMKYAGNQRNVAMQQQEKCATVRPA